MKPAFANIELTLEVRSADGTAAEFYQADAEHVGKALRFLTTPRLFTEPQFVLASEKWVAVLATRTIDVILARTAALVPEVLPLKSPAGPIDITEVEECLLDEDRSVVFGQRDRRNVNGMNSRSFRVEVRTLGGWTNILAGSGRTDSRHGSGLTPHLRAHFPASGNSV